MPFAVLGDWNRRFETPGDTFWPEIDDSVPMNADLMRVTEGKTSECWDREFPLYIDHIAVGKQVTEWVVANSFTQIVYDEDTSFKKKLSDHCPISIALAMGETLENRLRADLLLRIQAMETELAALRQLVESMPQ